ncbi:hypothetical protein ACF1GY_34755 [Streptomyces sp. NPDC014684]|uniref:hypothetical protein n=1 Tax=Streptomyces sp. NPDC014684 TaxID=3364880 RepID=UPI0036FBAF77
MKTSTMLTTLAALAATGLSTLGAAPAVSADSPAPASPARTPLAASVSRSGSSSNAAASGSWSGYNVSVYTGGKQRGQAWGSVHWINATSFSIPDYWLKDTSCDSHSVFSFIDVGGLWQGTKRWNHHCGSKIDFGQVHAEDREGIRYVGIWVCRDELTDACTHKNFKNPYA